MMYCYFTSLTLLFIIWRRCYSVGNVISLKSYDHMCNNTLGRTRNVIDNVRVNNSFIELLFILKGDKIPF